MRVIAGSRRSMPLKAPAGLDTRPTQDRTKETLFNVLQNDIPGSVFVDLFSGSGGIGIEALSRGAKKAYFVENNKAALSCIKENLKFTKFIEESVVLETDVMFEEMCKQCIMSSIGSNLSDGLCMTSALAKEKLEKSIHIYSI
jgi:16S rRNA (guanine966-N2)-methyltransferase